MLSELDQSEEMSPPTEPAPAPPTEVDPALPLDPAPALPSDPPPPLGILPVSLALYVALHNEYRSYLAILVLKTLVLYLVL